MGFEAGSRAARAVLRASAAALALISGAGAIAGCATFGLDGNVYHGDGYSFRLPAAPSGWEPIDVSDAALAYRDEPSAGTILVNGRCDKDGDDVPLSSLTQHLFMRFTDREITREETVPFDGREALHTVITAKLDGVPKSFSAWVLKKDGCVYDLVYVADPERFGAGAARFDAYATQLHILPRDGDEGP
jgi:hypothetical protein